MLVSASGASKNNLKKAYLSIVAQIIYFVKHFDIKHPPQGVYIDFYEHQLQFMMGTVEDNNKLRKGMPLVRLPKCVMTHTTSEITLYGHGVDCYTRTMSILHPEEYWYLLEHPDYWEIWAWAARSSKNWCRWVEEMYQHFEDAAAIVEAG